MAKPRGGGASVRPPNSSSRAGDAKSSDRAASNARAQGFLKSMAAEIRRITWPTRREWVSATVLTVALVVGIGLFTDLVDVLCTWLFGLVRH